MTAQTNPVAGELVQPEKIAAVLMTMKGEASRERYFKLNGHMNDLIDLGAARVRLQAAVVEARPLYRAASQSLVGLNEGTIAYLALEHASALSKLPPADGPAATPDFLTRLLLAILGEVDAKSAQAVAVAPRRLLTHYTLSSEVLTTAQGKLAAVTEKETSAKLRLITYTADCREFIHDNTTAADPVRKALKRKVTRQVNPMMAVAAGLEKERGQRAKKRAKAQAMLDALNRGEAESHANLLKQVGLESLAVVVAPKPTTT